MILKPFVLAALLVVADGWAVQISCKEHIRNHVNKDWKEYCMSRCDFWFGYYGSRFCPDNDTLEGLVACVHMMDWGACSYVADPNSTSTASAGPETTQPPTPAPTLPVAPTGNAPPPITPTTPAAPNPATANTPSTPTTTPTTTPTPTTSTTTSTTPAPATPGPTSTAVAATTVAATVGPTVVPPANLSTTSAGSGGVAGDDAPENPISGPTGPNGECVWGYAPGDYSQGVYAGIKETVYRAKYWASASQVPGADGVWEDVAQCVGEAPKSLTLEEMVASVEDPNVPTIFYDPWTPLIPSKSEARAAEAAVAKEPGVQTLKDAVRVLGSAEVEKIAPGREENPENVKRVERTIKPDTFDQIFPFRHRLYSYENYLKAVGAFPDYCKTYHDGRDSEAICKKLMAASFAHYAQETGANAPAWTIAQPDLDAEHRNPGAAKFFDAHTPVPIFLQGLYWVRETAFAGPDGESTKTSQYESCNPIADQPWSIFMRCPGEVTYFGRGSKQLSWNYNYGWFSQALYGDTDKLLREPRLVAETWLNFASGIWFAVTPQSPKPPMTWALDGTWTGSDLDRANGLAPGFGATIEIINGGYECGKGTTTPQAANRILAYKNFMKLFGLTISPDEPLDCANSKGFPPSSPASTALYWSKNYAKPGTCKQDTMQTPFKVTTDGDYSRCVNFYFRSHVIYQSKEIITNGDTKW